MELKQLYFLRKLLFHVFPNYHILLKKQEIPLRILLIFKIIIPFENLQLKLRLSSRFKEKEA